MENISDKKNKALTVLMIHDSNVVRTIIKEYIRSDHPDAVVIFAASASDGARRIASKRCDIIFSGDEMTGMNGAALFDGLSNSEVNRQTPFVIMTATDTSQNRRRFMDAGIRHILPIPCTSMAFRKLIYRIFNPQANRDHTLYCLPSSKAVIGTDDQAVPMEIVNISRDSLVCETDRTEISGSLENAQTFKLHFPADYGKASTILIGGRLNRIKSITQNRQSPKGYRVTWAIAWDQFELEAITKSPLKLAFNKRRRSLSDQGGGHPESGKKTGMRQKNSRLKSCVRRLALDKKSLLLKIKRLEQRISRLETDIANTPRGSASVSTLTNETAVPSTDKVKLDLFKRIIKDNIQIRTDNNNNK